MATSADSQPDESLWQRDLDALKRSEMLQAGLLAVAGITPIVVAAVILSVLAYESYQFFADPQEGVSLWNFLTQTEWNPLIGDASTRRYGIIVLMAATFLVATIAMIVAIPIGVLAAVFLAEYATGSQRSILKPALEALSGIPTVVYGYFALLVVTPALRTIFPSLSFNALSAGLMVGVLVAPTISSLSEEALRNVPNDLRLGAYSLGFCRNEAIVRVLLPAAAPGILAAIALALSRALGETMIVAIAAGQLPKLTLNPLMPVETMTTFIIQISQGTVGFGEFEFKAIFTVGMVLFLITLVLNSIGNWLSRRSNRVVAHLLDPQTREILPQRSSVTAARIPAAAAPARERIPSAPALEPTIERGTRRRLLEIAFRTVSFGAALVGVGAMGAILVSLFASGGANLSWQFVTSLTSRNPEETGILDPLMGTVWTISLTALLAIPTGIGAAVYLEEYLPINWLTRWLEITIANLAAVPTIIYGLLGLEVFARLLQAFNRLLSRWSGGNIPEGLVGGYTILSAALTLSAIVLPVLIVSSRAALAGVSADLRRGGYGVGMSKGQVLRAVVLPAALPRTITGALLALSLAIGETAALIAVGAVASVGFTPSVGFVPEGGWHLSEFWFSGVQSPYTTLPVQIFYWLQNPNEAVRANAATATLVLITGVIALNIAAVLLRDTADRHRRT